MEALQSVKEQTYTNIEIIVSDDASSDDTIEIIKQFQVENNFPIKIYSHKPQGIAENWNNCIKKATGKYIKFLFQDDLLNHNCVEEMVKVMELNTDVGLVTCKREVVYSKYTRFVQGWVDNFKDLQINLPLSKIDDVTILSGKSILKAPYFKKKPINIIGEPICILFKKSILKDIGYYRSDMFQLVDYEFCLRIFKKYDIAFLNKTLVKFRLHGQQASFLNHSTDKNDKDIFYKLLYSEYFWDLHSNFRWILIKKFHWSVKLYRWFRYKILNKSKNGIQYQEKN